MASGRKKSKKKKPWRYRWPDDFRDKVLARLLELNEQRHKEELLAGTSESLAGSKKKKPAKKKETTKTKTASTSNLFEPDLEPRHLSVLMVLRAWSGTRVSRRTLNGAIILFHRDSLRTALLGKTPIGRRKKTIDFDLAATVNELAIDGFINVDNTGAQQFLTVTDVAPSTDLSKANRKRIDEILEYVRQEQESGNVVLTEEAVDAEFDFVSV